MSVNVRHKTRIVTHAALPRFDEVCTCDVGTYYIMQSRKILSLSEYLLNYVGILEVLISCRFLYPYGLFQVLEFSMESGQLYLTVLTISMWDHRKIAKDVLLGKLNPSSQ